MYSRVKEQCPTLEAISRFCDALQVQYYNMDCWNSVYEQQRPYDKWGNYSEPVSKETIEKAAYEYMVTKAEQELLRRQAKSLVQTILSPDTTNTKWAFVTVNFDDTRITDATEVKILNQAVNKIINTPGLTNAKYVVEKFRKEEGIHRHIHFLFDTELRKSKIIQYIFQKVKDHVVGPQFIDVKTYKDNKKSVYEDYVRGVKRDEKMEYVEADRRWRKAKGIMECDL